MKYYFAPLEGITNHIFRRTYDKWFGGIDAYYTPFVTTRDGGIMKKKARYRVKRISMLKILLARRSSPCPIVIDTKAEPPVPIINPNAPMIMTAGQMTFSAAKAVVPTKLETNNPSTTLYILPTSIIRTLGIEDRTSRR